MNRFSLGVLGAVALGVLTVVPGVAGAHSFGSDSVDRTAREVRYQSSSDYGDAIKWAVGKWNALRHLRIYSSSKKTTLRIVDYTDTRTTTRGRYSNDTIRFNRARMNNKQGCGGQDLTYARRGTATHEFGHALRLAHPNRGDDPYSKLPSVMYSKCTTAL